MITKLEQLEEKITKQEKKRLCLVAAEDADSFCAVIQAYKKGWIHPVLIGDKEKIISLSKELSEDIDSFEIIDCSNHQEAAELGAKLASENKVQALMKGALSTAYYLRPILKKENKLVKGILSHAAVFEIPSYHKLLTITDAALNIRPNIQEKIEIIKNTAALCNSFGIKQPKTAYICAVEKVNPEKMPETEEAAILTQMANRGQLGNILFDGPLAIDNAVSEKSVAIKKIQSSVGGDADILIFPEIISCNAVYKTLGYLAGAKLGALILGSSIPIILTSRADNDETKLNSILTALSYSGG